MQHFRKGVLSLYILSPCPVWIVEVVEDHHKGPLPCLVPCRSPCFHSRCLLLHSPSPIVGQTLHHQLVSVPPSPAILSQTSHPPPPVSVSSFPIPPQPHPPLPPISQTTPLRCLHSMTGF